MPTTSNKTLQSYSQLRANFQAINKAFAENHVGLTKDESVGGMHNLLNLQVVTDPTTSATQIALYNKLVSSIPELFFMPSSSQTPIQMTYPSIQTGLQSTEPDVYYPQQYSFVAGPFIIYGGLFSAITSGTSKTLSPGTTLLHVDLTVQSGPFSLGNLNNTAVATSISGMSFTVNYSSSIPSPQNIYYFAVGLP